ncbi:MAG: hypothetical protein ACK5Y2_03940 [Bdellovibrionales bacterium]
MRLMILALGFVPFLSSAHTLAQKSESSSFSAFISTNILYVTVLGDTCNTLTGSLEVEESCRADVPRREPVETCQARLEISTTRKACPDRRRVPHVLEIDLRESRVAPDARILLLNHEDTTLRLRVNR